MRIAPRNWEFCDTCGFPHSLGDCIGLQKYMERIAQRNAQHDAEMAKRIKATWASLPQVIHGTEPPYTGAERCALCQGWILTDTRYWVGSYGPICPNCYSERNKQTTTMNNKSDTQAILDAIKTLAGIISAAYPLLEKLLKLLAARKEAHEMTADEEAQYDADVRQRQAMGHWVVSGGAEPPAAMADKIAGGGAA